MWRVRVLLQAKDADYEGRGIIVQIHDRHERILLPRRSALIHLY